MALVKNADAQSMIKDAIVLDFSDLRRQADVLMNKSKAEANKLLTTARTEATKLVNEASDKGYKEGFEAGKEEGNALGRKEGHTQALKEMSEQFKVLLTEWTATSQAWEDSRGQMLLEAREDVLAFAIALAEKLVYRVIEVDTSVVVDQVAEALVMVTRPSSVTVSINPQDRPMVEEAMPELLETMSQCKHISITEAADIERGGCRVTTVGGSIDATISGQIEQIIESMLPSLPEHDEGTPGTPGNTADSEQ